MADCTITIDDLRNATPESAAAFENYKHCLRWQTEDDAHRVMLGAYLDDHFTDKELFGFYMVLNSITGEFEWANVEPLRELCYGVDADFVCMVYNHLQMDHVKSIEPDTLVHFVDGYLETTSWDDIWDTCDWCTGDLAYVLLNNKYISFDDISRELEYVAPNLLERWTAIQDVLLEWEYGRD